MVTLVSAGFGIFHIVLQGQNFDVALFGDHICDPVDIRGEGAGDPYTGDVVDVLNHVFQGGFIAVFFQFFDNALRSFDPGFNMFNGIITVNVKKFFVENFYFLCRFPLMQRCKGKLKFPAVCIFQNLQGKSIFCHFVFLLKKLTFDSPPGRYALVKGVFFFADL